MNPFGQTYQFIPGSMQPPNGSRFFGPYEMFNPMTQQPQRPATSSHPSPYQIPAGHHQPPALYPQYQAMPQSAQMYYPQPTVQPVKPSHQAAQPPRKSHAIAIVDPVSNRNILDDMVTASTPKQSQSSSPAQSRDSSASNTPAPRDTPPGKNPSSNVASEFALAVALKATHIEDDSPNKSLIVDNVESVLTSSSDNASDIVNENRDRNSVNSVVDNLATKIVPNVPESNLNTDVNPSNRVVEEQPPRMQRGPSQSQNKVAQKVTTASQPISVEQPLMQKPNVKASPQEAVQQHSKPAGVIPRPPIKVENIDTRQPPPPIPTSFNIPPPSMQPQYAANNYPPPSTLYNQPPTTYDQISSSSKEAKVVVDKQSVAPAAEPSTSTEVKLKAEVIKEEKPSIPTEIAQVIKPNVEADAKPIKSSQETAGKRVKEKSEDIPTVEKSEQRPSGEGASAPTDGSGKVKSPQLPPSEKAATDISNVTNSNTSQSPKKLDELVDNSKEKTPTEKVDIVEDTKEIESSSSSKGIAQSKILKNTELAAPPRTNALETKIELGNLEAATTDESVSPVTTTVSSETGARSKLQYDRTFLLNLRGNPLSNKKPEALPNLEVVLDGPNKVNPKMSFGGASAMEDFTPLFLLAQNKKPYGGGGGGGNMNYKRSGGSNSQSGQRRQQKVIEINLSARTEAVLNTTKDAWKPNAKVEAVVTDKTEEERIADDILKKMRGILNKLTPDNFEKLVRIVKALNLDTPDHLNTIIGLIFEKAVDEQAFSSTYAKLCHYFATDSLRQNSTAKDNKEAKFRSLIINKCQKEFEKDNAKDDKLLEMRNEIKDCKDPVKKKTLQAHYNLEETRLRKRSVGNIRFIGELYKLRMLTSPIMMRIIGGLLDKPDEESLECLCKLLSTIGSTLEGTAKNSTNSGATMELDRQFNRMHDLIGDKATHSRIRFLMMDVIDLRKTNWVPRRKNNDPKTKAEVHEEMRKEEEAQQHAILMNDRGLPPPRNNNDRERKRSRDNRGQQDDTGGWTSVVSTARRPNFEPDRLRNFNRHAAPEKNDVAFRPSVAWGMGSSGGNQGGAMSMRDNRYSLLEQDERKLTATGPPSRFGPGGGAPRGFGCSFGSKSMPPPSEKEKVLNVVKNLNSGLDRSKSNSRSTSRDSSRTRELEKVAPPIVEMTDQDEIADTAKKIFVKLMSSRDFKIATDLLFEKFSNKSVHKFITEAMNVSFDNKSEGRMFLGQWFQSLIKKKKITFSEFQKGSTGVVEIADDLAIDIPAIPQYFGEVFASLFTDATINLADLVELSSPANEEFKHLIFAKTLGVLNTMQPKRGLEILEESNFDWKTILPEGTSEAEFLTKMDLLKPVKEDTSLKGRLASFLKTPASDQETFDWIEANVPDVKEPEFARLLAIVLVKDVVDVVQASDSPHYLLNETFNAKMKTRGKIMHRYVENNEKLELYSIFGIQALCTDLEFPKGLLEASFNVLYDSEVLSEESFMEWEKNIDPAESNGKSICVSQVRKFLKWLKETEAEAPTSLANPTTQLPPDESPQPPPPQ